MTKIKFIPFIIAACIFCGTSLADNKKDCSKIEADTGAKMYEKWKCMSGKSDGEGIGKKLKNFFKKKE